MEFLDTFVTRRNVMGAAGALVILTAGMWIGSALVWRGMSAYSGDLVSTEVDNATVRAKSGSYHYISPLLLCNTPEPTSPQEYLPFQNQVLSYIVTEKARGDLETASVYFRDLQKGLWTTANPTEHYSPASLLKVPIMIAVFTQAESDPAFLMKKIRYDGSFNEDANEEFKPSQPIRAGQSYTVEDLVHSMIAYSDNNAAELLYDNLDTDFINEIFRDLSLTPPPDNANVDFMTVGNYSYFFRLLYNATYLSRAYSEEAMRFLSEPDFTEGLEAGVPPGVEVAQKFGERTVYADAARTTVLDRELHDCGIIYYPDHPYLLCVMTRGKDFNKLTGVIQQITRMSYAMMQGDYGN